MLPLPGVFTSGDVYSRHRWRKVQYLSKEFWSWWQKEYLMSLQHKAKWNEVHKDFKIGDVVLLMTDADRNQ